MDYLPLILGTARPLAKKAGRSGKDKSGAGSSGSAPSFAAGGKIPVELKNKILERDQHRCRYCGFVAEKYQEIAFKNGDPTDQSEGNLVTACTFCEQCFNLEKVGLQKSGALIWLPEITQADLHHIARAIYVARISQGPIADTARKTYDLLMARREEAKRRISTDDPYILATVLRDYLSDAHYAARTKKLEGIRLFPLDRRLIKEADLEFNQFPQILAYWRSKAGPFGGKTPQQWVSFYQQISAAA